MCKLVRILLLVFVVVLVGAPCAAQFSPYFGGGGGLVNNMGVKNPNFTPTVGMDLAKARMVFNVEASAGTADKIDVGSGTLFRVIGRGYWWHKHWLLGGGVSRSQEFTSLYDKAAWHPRAALGYQAGEWALFGDYIFPQGDQQNAVQGAEVRFEVPINRRFALRYDTQVLHFHGTLQEADRQWGTTSTFLLLFHVTGEK